MLSCAGYCCGRKCQKEESNVPYADAEYEYFEQVPCIIIIIIIFIIIIFIIIIFINIIITSHRTVLWPVQRQLPARPVQPGMQPLLQHTDYKRPQEETLYAEPILINHNVNASNPLGTDLTIVFVGYLRLNVRLCSVQQHQYSTAMIHNQTRIYNLTFQHLFVLPKQRISN